MNKRTQNNARILIIAGTRPEIIKLAPIKHLFDQYNIAADWCHTGQHKEIADQMYDLFGIKPNYRLIRKNADSLSDLTSFLLSSIGDIINSSHYETIIVQGDTSSTLTGALAAFYAQVSQIAHVEAGLRTGNMYHPFPEESNRKIVSTFATHHFAPSQIAYDNLIAEGINPDMIQITGNTVVDAQKWFSINSNFFSGKEKHVLITAHRRENWPLIPALCNTIKKLSKQYPNHTFTFPVHPNPVVSGPVNKILGKTNNINIVPAMDYIELQKMLAKSCLVLTDSGGIQEEVPFYKVPCLVLREATERPEGIDSGIATLVGMNEETILELSGAYLDGSKEIPDVKNPYGDGNASLRIIQGLGYLEKVNAA